MILELLSNVVDLISSNISINHDMFLYGTPFFIGAVYNKFQDFVEQLGLAKHDLSAAGHVLKVYLSNTAPDAALDAVKADLAEIAAGNGYTAGGVDVQNTWAESTGTGTLSGTKVVITASGGTIGPFRYVALYNDTQTVPADPLVAWWDYGSALTLNDGESFSVKFNDSDTTGTILTLA